MWLLDTNVWVCYLNPGETPVKAHMRQHAANNLWLCDVVKAELYFGAYKSSRQQQNLQLLSNLFQQFQSLAFDGHAAQTFGQLRAHLHRQGQPIGPYDLQIAAIALANDLTLVTHNRREFGRIDGLRLTDWEI
ncbi:MAG: type II toxin-antitoxin system VapC family toxin [Methylomonas sp.]|nr:type II toxin-antitoxin system VapC family toxin [Methylomonas sp.]